MADPKKIKLYKVKEDGQLDKNSQLLPETSIEAVEGLQTTLDNKQNTISDLDNIRSGAEAGATAVQPNELEIYLSKEDYLENAKYDKVEKEIPGEIVDGETYPLPKEYDNEWVLSIIEKEVVPSGDEFAIYAKEEEQYIAFSEGLIYSDVINQILYDYVPMSFTIDGTTYDPGWYIIDITSMPPVYTPYTGDINITIDTNYIIEGQEEILSKVLGIQPQIIEEDRTLKQKNEDIKNWTYDRKEHKEIIYGFKDGVNYKFNFNAIEYLDKFSQFTPYPNQTYIYGYNGDETLDDNCSIYSNGVYCSTFRIVINGIEYYFVIDVNNEKLGTWRKGYSLNSEAYTDEELEDITFVLDLTKVSQDYAEFVKEVLLDLDDNPVEELVDGTTYKINFDVRDYLDIFDWYSDNGKTVSGTYDWYIYGDSSVGANSICYYSSGSLGSLYIGLPDNSYYLCPTLGTYYPGRWYKSSDIRPSNLRTDEELRDVEFTMNRKAIVDEELLRVITTNVDGSPIEEDKEETIIEIIKVDDKFNEPLKDKIYDSFIKTIEVVEDIVDDTDYTFKNDMQFNEQDNYLFENLGNRALIYNDEANNISIVYGTEGGRAWSDNYLEYYDGNSYYKYIIEDIWNEVFKNEWDYEIPENDITIYTECIVNNDILKRMLNLPSHEEIIIINQTLKEKNDDLPNWKYGTKEGILDVPNWIIDISYTVNWETIYEEENICSVYCNYDNDGISYELYDMVNDIGYTIFNYIRIGEDDEKYSANTWYSFSLTDESAPLEKCDTPNIILNKNYATPFYLELFNAFYGLRFVTLKEEIDEIKEEISKPLKDRIYGNDGDLIDGEEYTLKEDYKEFFDKYAHGQSTLLYGEEFIDANGNLDAMEVPKSSNSLDRDVDKPTIIGIYLYTDSTPTPSPSPKEVTRDGASQYNDSGVTPISGGAVIDVYTNQGTIIFNQDGDGWYYEDTKISTEQLPTLILDSSLIQNEEMLKTFLGGSPITLEEKFNKVENAELKNKLYNIIYKETTVTVFKESPTVLSAPTTSSYTFYNDEINGITIEYDRSYGTNYFKVKKNGDLIATIDNDSPYPWSWYPSYPKDIILDKKYLLESGGYNWENTFNNLTEENIIKVEVSQSLEDKFNEDLKDKTYETYLDETKKAFKTSIDWSAFEDLEIGEVFVYGTSEENPKILVGKNRVDNKIVYVIAYMLEGNFEDDSAKGYLIYSQNTPIAEANTWIYMDTTGEEPIFRLEVPQPFVYDSEKIQDMTLFDCICEDAIIKQTLEEKLNEIEAPYTITDYTENNGALTSITVKDKTTGEPTTLVVGGGGLKSNGIYTMNSGGTDMEPISADPKILALPKSDIINVMSASAVDFNFDLQVGDLVISDCDMGWDGEPYVYYGSICLYIGDKPNDSTKAMLLISNNTMPMPEKTYEHNICFRIGNQYVGQFFVTMELLRDSDTHLTMNDIALFLRDNYLFDPNGTTHICYPKCNITMSSGEKYVNIVMAGSNDDTKIYIRYQDADNNFTSQNLLLNISDAEIKEYTTLEI